MPIIVYTKIPAVISVDSSSIRYGRSIQLFWVNGDVKSGVVSGDEIIRYNVPAGYVVYLYGFFISSGDQNTFQIEYSYGNVVRYFLIPFVSSGILHYDSGIAFNEGEPIDKYVSIKALYTGAGKYQGRLLIGQMKT